jgi:hypothetical protein
MQLPWLSQLCLTGCRSDLLKAMWIGFIQSREAKKMSVKYDVFLQP